MKKKAQKQYRQGLASNKATHTSVRPSRPKTGKRSASEKASRRRKKVRAEDHGNGT